MTNIIWYVTAERQKLLDALMDVPEYGKRKRSEIIEMAIREFLEKHGTSENPQTRIGNFDSEEIRAVPNLYRDEETWKTFYKLIKKIADYKEVDKQINMINHIHNQKNKEFF